MNSCDINLCVSRQRITSNSPSHSNRSPSAVSSSPWRSCLHQVFLVFALTMRYVSLCCNLSKFTTAVFTRHSRVSVFACFHNWVKIGSTTASTCTTWPCRRSHCLSKLHTLQLPLGNFASRRRRLIDRWFTGHFRLVIWLFFAPKFTPGRIRILFNTLSWSIRRFSGFSNVESFAFLLKFETIFLVNWQGFLVERSVASGTRIKLLWSPVFLRLFLVWSCSLTLLCQLVIKIRLLLRWSLRGIIISSLFRFRRFWA